jgi:hypothetical protein
MLESFNQLLKNIKRLTPEYMGRKVFKEKTLKKSVADLNREQLLSGRGADGELLPRYVDDPWFKSPESALRYQKWKSTISPGEKPADVMDFYIDGTFHRTIKFRKDDEGITTISESQIVGSVQRKTSNQALGLNDKSIEKILPEFTEYVQDLLLKDLLKGV